MSLCANTTVVGMPWLVGYKYGKADAAVGVRDPIGSCPEPQGIVGSKNVFDCTTGYTVAYNQFCGPSGGSKFACNS